MANPNAVFDFLLRRLTGLSSAVATAVTENDTILAAIGKLQGQINGSIFSAKIIAYASGDYYNQAHSMPHITGTAAAAAGTAYYFPFLAQSDLQAAQIAMSVSTAAAGSTVFIGVYNSDASQKPNTRIFASSVIDTSTIGDKLITQSLTLSARSVYWVGVVVLGGAPTLRAIASQYLRPVGGTTSASGSPSTVYLGTSQTALALNGAEIQALTKASSFAPAISFIAA